MAEWSERAQGSRRADWSKACFDALSRICKRRSRRRRGWLLASKDLLTELAVTPGLQRLRQRWSLEMRSSRLLFRKRFRREGYQATAAAEAAGSHERQKARPPPARARMRPLQRILAKEARISVGGVCADQPRYLAPSFLLDYSSLGAAYKYAGAMTRA